MPPSCVLEQDSQGEVRVINPESCSDKELVKYLNCNGYYLQDIQKKGCQ